jgi:predicted RNA-binding protein (virulence factor B family)
MINPGKKIKLEVVKLVEFGVYLAEDKADRETVLLPIKQVPEGTKEGDEIEVFIYRDSEDRLIATVNEPKLMLGEVAVLLVKEVGKIGAFLDMGLEKDLLLPFREQTKRAKEGEKVLVALYIDKSKRLCATMNVYEYLDTNSTFQKDDMVEGRIYQISKEFGAFVAVEDKYSGLIPAKEFNSKEQIGDIVTARVTGVKEDGKIDLSLRKKAYLQMQEDAMAVMEAIEDEGGSLPFNDKASPELIRQEMGMSKNEFKRAVGNLLKAGKIEILPDSIRKK